MVTKNCCYLSVNDLSRLRQSDPEACVQTLFGSAFSEKDRMHREESAQKVKDGKTIEESQRQAEVS
jgi:gluconate kinase